MKRGQITVFIVVGIIILFAIGFVIYIAGIQPGLNIFSQKESEIQQYLGSCIEQVSEDGINIIGRTGGYLDVPQNIAVNEKAYFSFSPRGEPKIPLWYYRGQPRAPTKKFISGQISEYVVKNIDSCLSNFDVFKDRFNIRLRGNVTAETTIENTNVFVKLNYPLELTSKVNGEITDVDFVGRNIPVKLGEMYDAALGILISENRGTFFENLTMGLLASNPDFPFTNMDFSCSPRTWRKSELIDFAQNMLFYNLQRATVQGNSFRFFDNNDLYARNNFVMPLDKTYPDLGVVFFYPRSSRFELHVRPNDREILKSDVGRSQNPLLKFFCVNTNHYTYDIEYPLLTSLKDNSAFSGRGFIFNFAFPVTINHNEGDKTDFSITTFESPDLNYDFCSDTSSQPVDVRVKNAYTLEELYKAPVDYKCVRYLCDLGNTTAEGGLYRLNAHLPNGCANGLLSSAPEGYLEGSTVYDGSGNAEILVKPLRTLKVNVVKHDSDDLARTENLKPGESVTISVSSLTENGFEQFYISDSQFNEIQLVDGDAKYHIDALLLQDGERLIGGYVGDVDIKYEDLVDKSQITFNLVQKIPLAVTEAEQDATAEYLFDDRSYQEPLKPSFS